MKELGADEVVNYDKDNVAAKVGMVDIVINTVAGERETALTYVKKGGTLVSVVGLPAPDKCMSAGVTCITFSAQEYPGPSKGQTLPTMAKLADSGQYHVDVEKTFPLDQAAAAQTASEAHTKGKIVLIVGPESKQK